MSTQKNAAILSPLHAQKQDKQANLERKRSAQRTNKIKESMKDTRQTTNGDDFSFCDLSIHSEIYKSGRVMRRAA